MDILKKFFEIYGHLLLLFRRIHNIFPKVRNVTCKKHNEFKNLTIQFYVIRFLIFIKFYLPFLGIVIDYFIKFVNYKIHKAKIDFYLDDNHHSIILVKGETLLDIIQTFSNFMKDYNNSQNNIIYDSYCCKISNVIIKSNGETLKEYSFDFMKKTVSQFRGVDSEFNEFCTKREEYGISNKLVDVLDMNGCKHIIDSVEITKIPPTIKKFFGKEHLDKLELDQIDY